MDASAGVRQEESPELGAKGESGAVKTKTQINPSCRGTVVLGVHFFCWLSPLFSCRCLCVHLCFPVKQQYNCHRHLDPKHVLSPRNLYDITNFLLAF